MALSHSETIPARAQTGLWESDLSPGPDQEHVGPGIQRCQDQDWICLVRACPGSPDSPTDVLCGHRFAPGLWKPVRDRAGLIERFDLPGAGTGMPCHRVSSAGEGLDRQSIVSWAIATAQGGVPGDWHVPEDLQSQIPSGRFLVHHRRFLQRGWLVQTEKLFALRTRLIDGLPTDLDGRRAAWLRRTLLDAQTRLRFVRFRASPEWDHVIAEVDFSGAPTGLLPDLYQIGLDALRQSFTWLAASVDLIVNADLDARILNSCTL